jgi:hypothetical protein
VLLVLVFECSESVSHLVLLVLVFECSESVSHLVLLVLVFECSQSVSHLVLLVLVFECSQSVSHLVLLVLVFQCSESVSHLVLPARAVAALAHAAPESEPGSRQRSGGQRLRNSLTSLGVECACQRASGVLKTSGCCGQCSGRRRLAGWQLQQAHLPFPPAADR